jgi:hypothetical protein
MACLKCSGLEERANSSTREQKSPALTMRRGSLA